MTGKNTRYVALMKAFGNAVRACRNQLGLSQEALAERASLDRSYMSQIERGIKNATLNSIWRISQSLQVAPSDLLRLAEQIDSGEHQVIPTSKPSRGASAVATSTAAPLVLVVDDDFDIASAVGMMLQDAGLQTLQAESGMEAIRLMASAPVSAVVSDVRMANGNGLELLDAVQRFHPGIPLFFITGYDDLVVDDVVRRGASGLFSKPFDTGKFVSSIKSAVQ